MSQIVVLDSFAVLALLGGEPGSDQVADVLRRCRLGETRVLMTWVNLGEVAYIVERRWGVPRMQSVLALLEAGGLTLVEVGRDLALRASRIKASHAVAFADAFAAALAIEVDAEVLTGDPEFARLEPTVRVRWLAAHTS